MDFRYRVCGIWLRHRAEIILLEQNKSFTDLMLKGIYHSFRHTHEFKSSGGVPVLRTRWNLLSGWEK